MKLIREDSRLSDNNQRQFNPLSLPTRVHTRITGWKFEATGGSPRVCSANETHAVMTSGNHNVFNAEKPLPNWKMSTI